MDLDTELPKAYELAKEGNFEGATRITFAAIHAHGMLAAKHPMYVKAVLVYPYAAWLLSPAASPFLKALHAERSAAFHQEAK